MAVFPSDTIIPNYDYEVVQEWKTVISTFDGANEQRKQKWTFPKYHVKLTFGPLSHADVATLWKFYQARKGAYEAFYFYTVESEAWEDLYVATGDGSTKIFDLPGKTTSSQVIYISGDQQDSGYTILVGGGDGSSDRIEFTTAPAEGDVISCDFTGYMRILCRFKQDNMSRTLFEYNLYRVGLELQGFSAG